MSDAELFPGIGIRPWRHLFTRFDAGARVSIHPGARRVDRGIEPVRPARPPTRDELETLDGARHPDRPAIDVFSTPALLRELFADLDPDELPGTSAGGGPRGPTPVPSPGWSRFADDVARFFAHVRAPLVPPYRLSIDVRDPSLPTPLLATGSCRDVLEDEAAEDPSTDVPFAAHVNLGDGPIDLVWWTVPVFAMRALLEKNGLGAPPGARDVADRFVQRYPRCPAVRLSLPPGEGVFVPVARVVHDVDPVGSADLAITLTARPGAQG